MARAEPANIIRFLTAGSELHISDTVYLILYLELLMWNFDLNGLSEDINLKTGTSGRTRFLRFLKVRSTFRARASV